MIAAVLAVVVALALAIGISLLTGGRRSANGCIDVTISNSLGGQELYRCGAAARAICSSLGAAGGYSGTAGVDVARECRRAGLRVGS